MSEYHVTVIAATRTDAIDIAKRRAREGGYRSEGPARVVSVPNHPARWAVTLQVVPA